MSEAEETGLADTVVRNETGEDLAPMYCLDEDAILDFLDRRLPAERAARVEMHIDECGACRQLLALAAQDSGASVGDGQHDTLAPSPMSSAAADVRPVDGARPLLSSAETLEILAPGEKIDHFEVKQILGRGGMGEVYLAKDTHLKRNVAIKLISQKLVSSEEAKQRFLVEARATARFSHPNIVAIHSVGEYQNRPYIALEYVEGDTLRSRMDVGRLGLGEALHIASTIALALREAHANQVLHRDLKPQNVILARDGRLRVLDFGLAKLRPRTIPTRSPVPMTADDGAHSLLDMSSVLPADLTLRDSIRGTPGYMAPEQWRSEPITEAADIWAFGVILYELISGERPYRETSAISYAVKVCEPSPAPSLPPIAGVPRALAELTEKCLAKDPAARPTAEMVLTALRGLLGEEPVKLIAEMEQAAARWDRSGGVEGALWEGAELARAEQLMEKRALPLDAKAARFWSASIRRSRDTERKKRRRVTIAGVLATSFAALSLMFAFISVERKKEADRDKLRAERARAAAMVESANRAFGEAELLEARAKLRSALEVDDSALARVLWWRVDRDPLVWSRALGTGIFDVAFSPDGRKLAAAAQDKTVYLLDAETLALTSLRGHADQAMKVAFSPDGKLLASSSWSGELFVWNTGDHAVRVLAGHKKRLGSLIFLSDQRIAAAEHDGAIWIWDLARGASAPELFSDSTKGSFDLVISPDQKLIYSAEKDGRVRVFDLAEKKMVREIPTGAKGAVLSLALSADGKYLVTGGEDRLVRSFELSGSPARARELGAAEGTIQRVRFVGREGAIVAVGQDKLVRIFSHSARRDRLEAHTGPIWSVAPSPDGQVFATAGLDGTLRLWRTRASSGTKIAKGHGDGVSALAFSADGKILASGGYDRLIRLWDVETGAEQRLLSGHEGTIYGLARDPLGKHWASASYDRTVRVWSAESGKLEQVLIGHKEGVYAVAFDPSGHRLVSGGTDRTVRLWDLSTGTELKTFTGHAGPVFAVAFSPDGKKIASGSADKTIRLWDTEGKKEPIILSGHESSIWGVAFSPGGTWLASGGYDQTVRVWDLPKKSGRILGKHGGRVYGVDFHPDGQHVVAGGADGKAMIWSLSGGPGREITGHRGEVNRVEVAPNGMLIATASDDGTVRVWETSTARPYWNAPLLEPGAVRLATRAGWSSLRDPSAPVAAAKEAWAQRLSAAKIAAISAEGGRACLATYEGELEAWELGEDKMSFRAPVEGLRSLRALEKGCAAIAGERVLLFDDRGAFKELGAGATAIEVSRSRRGEELLVGMPDRVQVLDARGRYKRELAASRGVTALARAGAHVMLGYVNGTIEAAVPLSKMSVDQEDPDLEPADVLELPPRFSFEGTPSSPITRIVEGPMETLIAGYANGWIGIWSMKNGALLYEARLHGAVIHLAVEEGAIWAASELGSALAGPDGFASSHCELLRRVWSEIPVIWSDGLPESAEPPPHRCLEAGE